MSYQLTPRDLDRISAQVEHFPALSPEQSARLSTLLGGGHR